MKFYQAVVDYYQDCGTVCSNCYTLHADRRPRDEKTIVKDGKHLRRVAYFFDPVKAAEWMEVAKTRPVRPIDFIDRRRIDCESCPERDTCEGVKVDCPLDDPPTFPVAALLPEESRVDSLIRIHGWPRRIQARDCAASLIGVQPLTAGRVAPVYRFPGGDSIVDDCEMVPYE